MSKPILVVFGASGNQGNSAATFVLNDPELSKRYTVRAISRDPSNPKILALQSRGAQIIQADLDDPSSLPAALKDAKYAFLVTTTSYTGGTRAKETRQAKAFCTAALAQGLEYVIWSSMSHPALLSGGKYAGVEYFDDKAEIEAYIRSLPIKSAHYAPGSFFQNFDTQLRPKPGGDGTYVMRAIAHPSTRIPYVDIADTGKWVGAILAAPEMYEGRFFAAAHRLYTLPEVCEIISKVTGKTVRYEQMEDEMFKSFVPEAMRQSAFEMWAFIREFGYYGSEQEELLKWAREQARGEPRSLEEYLRASGYSLE